MIIIVLLVGVKGERYEKKRVYIKQGLSCCCFGAMAGGSTLLSILEERAFPVAKLYLAASARSAGELCEFKGDDL